MIRSRIGLKTRLLLQLVAIGSLLVAGSDVATWAQAPTRAGSPIFRARTYVLPEKPNTTASFRLVVEVEGSRVPKVVPPTLPTIPNVRVLNGPITETTRTSTNGVVKASVRLSWTLMAEKAGVTTLPAMALLVEGQSLQTAALAIKIAEGPARPTTGGKPSGNSDDAVILTTKLDQESVWVGQPVLLEVTLFSVPQVTNFGWDSRPTLGAFWSELESVDLEKEQFQADIRGQSYNAYPIERQILIPTTAGEFEIDPYSAQIQVRTRSRRSFDFFDFGRSAVVMRASRPVDLKVRQLPRKDKPDDFSGAVGQFSLKAEFDRIDAQVDDAVALRVTLDGNGSLRAVGAPVLNLPVDLEVFAPQLKESRFLRSGGKFKSRKSWEWIVVPIAPGTFEIPEIRVPYFDSAKGEYAVATTPAMQLAVEPSDGRPDTVQATRTLSATQKELHFIKPLDGPLRLRSLRLHEAAYFPALLALPLLLTPMAILFNRRRMRLNRDVGQVRARRAKGRARKKFRAIQKRLESMDGAEFHEEVGRTLVDFVADRFNRSGAGLTYDAADELLTSSGVDSELSGRFRACLERCDFARFVPSASQAARKQDLLDEVSTLIDALERAWK